MLLKEISFNVFVSYLILSFRIIGLAIFVGAFFYSKKYDVVVQPSIVAYATQLPFILGLVGITYGIMSASWDEVKKCQIWLI